MHPLSSRMKLMSQKRILFKSRTHKAVEYITFMIVINFGQWASPPALLFRCFSSVQSLIPTVDSSLAGILRRKILRRHLLSLSLAASMNGDRSGV